MLNFYYLYVILFLGWINFWWFRRKFLGRKGERLSFSYLECIGSKGLGIFYYGFSFLLEFRDRMWSRELIIFIIVGGLDLYWYVGSD